MPIPVRKQAVSLRIGASDVRRVKQLGQRLGVGDSEIIRFAVKTMLSKLAPLCDPNIRGNRLLPMFVDDYANEFLRHFDLDSERLNDIVNAGTDEDSQVEMEDIQLIAMSSMRPVAPIAPVAPLRQVAPCSFDTVRSNAVVALMADGKK